MRLKYLIGSEKHSETDGCKALTTMHVPKGFATLPEDIVAGFAREQEVGKESENNTGLSKKIPAKFSDTCSVRADGLCIG